MSELSDFYYFIDFLQKKIKRSHDKLVLTLPLLEARLGEVHGKAAIEKAREIIRDLPDGTSVELSSKVTIDSIRPIPDHDAIYELDTLTIDLKRLIIFSLLTVEKSDGRSVSKNFKLDNLLDNLDSEKQDKPQKASLTEFIISDPRLDGLKRMIQDNVKELRSINGRRSSLEHIALNYGGRHDVEIEWLKSGQDIINPNPIISSSRLKRKDMDFISHVISEVQLVVDIRNLCGELAKTIEKSTEGKESLGSSV